MINLTELLADRETFSKMAIERRINRLPDLEAAYIEAVEVIRHLDGFLASKGFSDADPLVRGMARKFLVGDIQ